MLAIFVAVLVIQLFLAFLTAEDAHSRGHDKAFWFVAVLIFGILAIIVYLLVRNDTEVPVSERKAPRDHSKTKEYGSYIVIAILGLLVFSALGNTVAESVYPMPEDSCEWETQEHRGEQREVLSCDPDDYKSEQRDVVQEKRDNLTSASSLLGLIIPPYLWYRVQS